MARLSFAKLERHLLGAADRLRQEGLDAATYKDYIHGLLFLKRCSDSFDAEYEKIISARVARGMDTAEAKEKYGENPAYYDGFFVPERARWQYLLDRLNDNTVVYGSVLDTPLGALSEANDSLEHVLDDIGFMKIPPIAITDAQFEAVLKGQTSNRARDADAARGALSHHGPGAA